MTNGDELSFRSGSLLPDSQYDSVLIPKVAFPIMAREIRHTPFYAISEPHQYMSIDNCIGRKSRFGNHGMDDACRALQVLSVWDQFEYHDLSWESRNRLLNRGFDTYDTLDDFKKECRRLRLKFGKRSSQRRQLNALVNCLDVLESAFWEEVQSMANSALQTVTKHVKSRDTSLGRIVYTKPPASPLARLLRPLGHA